MTGTTQRHLPIWTLSTWWGWRLVNFNSPSFRVNCCTENIDQDQTSVKKGTCHGLRWQAHCGRSSQPCTQARRKPTEILLLSGENFQCSQRKLRFPKSQTREASPTTRRRLFGGRPHHRHQKCGQILQQIPLDTSVASGCTGKYPTVAFTQEPNPTHSVWRIPSIFHRTQCLVWQKAISHQLH